MIKRIPYLLILAATLLTAGCSKHDEIDFDGVVVDARQCYSSSAFGNNYAYFVQMASPSDAGASYTTLNTNEHYDNVVMLFEPDRRIYKGDHLTGTFYYDKGYCRANCGSWSDVDVPEGVFASID